MMDNPTGRPRDPVGRFVSTQYPDPNCDGSYQPEGDGWWRCNGLTHLTETGPLVACENGVAPPWVERIVL
jgi:hypothetical protein